MKISTDDFAIVVTNSHISVVPITVFLQSLFQYNKEEVDSVISDFMINNSLKLVTKNNNILKAELADKLNEKFLIY